MASTATRSACAEMSLCARRRPWEPPARGFSLLTQAVPPASRALKPSPVHAHTRTAPPLRTNSPPRAQQESAPAPLRPPHLPLTDTGLWARQLACPQPRKPSPSLPSAIPRCLCWTQGQRSPAEPSEGPLLPSPPGSSFQAHGSLLSRPLCRTFSFLVSRDRHAQGSVHGPHPSSPQHSFLGARITPRALNIISHTPLWLRSPTPEPQAHLSAAHSTPFPGCPRGTSNPTHTVPSSEICSVSGTDISVSPGHPAKTRVLILESALA